MRDAIVFLLVCVSLPLSFRMPFLGLLVFSWLAYMRPQDLCWGFARNMRLSFYVGLALIVGFLVSDMGRRSFMRRDIRSFAMIVILLLTYISTMFADVKDQYVTAGLIEFTKIIAIGLLTSAQLDSTKRLRIMLLTIGLCLGFFGFKGGLFGLLGGGSIERGPGGMMEDNNDFALALVMSLPILYYLAMTEAQKLFRQFLFITFGLTCLTIMLTHSRGGFLSMALVFGLIAWRAGKLMNAAAVGVAFSVIFLVLAPDSLRDRLLSIGDAAEGEDASANARFRAWAIGLEMIKENTWIGIGHKNFRHLYGEYAEILFPGTHAFNHVAHNSYIQMFAETGIFAFAGFLTMMISCYFAAAKLRRWSRQRPDVPWLRPYGNMAEATTAGFMLGGFFLNRAHFDLIYHWMGVVSAMMWLAPREMAATADTTADTGSRRQRGASAVSDAPVRPTFRTPTSVPAPAGGAALPSWQRRGR